MIIKRLNIPEKSMMTLKEYQNTVSEDPVEMYDNEWSSGACTHGNTELPFKLINDPYSGTKELRAKMLNHKCNDGNIIQ